MSDAWASLIRPVDAGANFAQSFQQGQVTNRQNMARNAMAALAQNPNNPRALAALAQADPETAMAFQHQRTEALKAQLGEHQENILRGAEIIRQLKPTDDASWQQAKAVAAQAGVDVSQVPDHYDQQYVHGIVGIADALKPLNDNSDQVVVTPQPGAPAMIYNKQTHQVQTLVAPNDGSHSVGAPAVPQVHDQSSYDAVPPSSQYMTPDGHVRVKGGQAGQPSPVPFR